MKNTVLYRLISFGYLHNQPPQADLLLDVRRVMHDPAALGEDLAGRDGRDEPVRRIVMAHPLADTLVHLATVYAETMSFEDLSCVIAIGCSHGRHRSVALVEHLAATLTTYNLPVEKRHLRLELLEDQHSRNGER